LCTVLAGIVTLLSDNPIAIRSSRAGLVASLLVQQILLVAHNRTAKTVISVLALITRGRTVGTQIALLKRPAFTDPIPLVTLLVIVVTLFDVTYGIAGVVL
jgi:hypothetical protein